MKILDLGVYGIQLSFNKDDKGGAAITTQMKEEDTRENSLFNSGVDGIESMILAHFVAGIDVTTPAYIEGVETAYQALGQHAEDIEPDYQTHDDHTVAEMIEAEGKVLIKEVKERSALIEETTLYTIDSNDWEQAMKNYDYEENSLFELGLESKVQSIVLKTDVLEELSEPDRTVERVSSL